MRSHADEYAPYLANIDINTYCDLRIMVPSAEIEELGIQALFAAVIEGARMQIDILCLDRSPVDGNINTVRYQLRTANGQPMPGTYSTIRLLYSIPYVTSF